MIFKVTYQKSEYVYCSNIARAESIKAVEAYYSKYVWFTAEQCDEIELEEAERKHMPIVDIETETETETVTETETETVSISTGNRKMGAIPSVSLPPVTTCAPGVPCAKKCYACKMCRIYPTVRAAYERNMRILRADPEQYFHQIECYLKSVRFFRWHVSGDIPTAEYFENMVKCAINNPHCEQLAFTKQYDIVNKWIATHGNLPKNLHIIFSLWNENWNTRVSNPYNLPCSAVIFRGQSADEYSNVCGGNCFECACRGVGCWAMRNGETIAFYEH